MKKNNIGSFCSIGFFMLFLITVSSNVSAVPVFSDNFEDGNHSGWLVGWFYRW